MIWEYVPTGTEEAFMRVRLFALSLALAAPALSLAQYPPPPPPGYGPPPPGYRPYREPGRRAGPADQGINLSARLGYGVPSGDISNDVDAAGFRIDPRLDDLISHKIPIWLELGYRFNPSVWGGLYLELAPASVESAFCPNGGCSANNVRFGLDLQFHLAPRQQVDPWVGIGVGYEVLNAESGLDLDGDGIADVTGDSSYSGWELPLLEAGVDFAASPRASFGPYLSWSVARYTDTRVSAPGFPEVSSSIGSRATHGWIEIGIKGTLKL